MRYYVHIILVWIISIFAKSSFAQSTNPSINPYLGGSADGHSKTELINQAFEPPSHFNAYFGGSGDGHHTAQLINQVFSSPIHFTPYFGGTGDGYDSAQLIAHTFGNPVHFNAFFGGSGDGQDMESIEAVLPPVDVLPPDIVCPANINVNTLPGQCYAQPNPGIATATDNAPGIIAITGTRCDGQPLNADYPKGLTTVTWTATDAAENSSTCTQTVTVTDIEKPVIDFCPANKTVNTLPTSTTCSIYISDANLGVATAHDNCGAVTISRQGVPSGNIFPVGETIITCSFADASNNTITCTQKITVQDKTKPVISCPANLIVNAAPGQCYAVILPASLGIGSAIDNCNGSVTISRSSLPVNNKYPVGITKITYSAKDASNNTITCLQTITVKDVNPPLITNVSANPSFLWPIDKKMKDVTIKYKSSDNCAMAGCVLSVSSSEPVTSRDDKTTPDWQIIDDHRIKLRAERISKVNGRTYTITITCTDKSGNKTKATTSVKVNHDSDDDYDDRPGGAVTIGETDEKAAVPKNETDIVEGLQIAAYPNPTNNHSWIEIKTTNTQDKIIMQVYDILGRRVEMRNNVQTDAIIRVGDKYKQGAYFIRINQGNEHKEIKLIKLSD